ncbi:MAG: glutamine amidotransferase [Candidatus Saccharibacteria bacterium]
MKPIKIVHLYPKEMNIYGDNGNVLVIKKRLQWRSIPCVVAACGVNDKLPSDTSIIIGGGGQDAGQSLVASDLQQKSKTLNKLSQDGVPMLMICGMYQMFGHYFKTQDDIKIPGIGLLDIYTVGEYGRLIGNISVKTRWGDIVGYENHSGRTYLASDTTKFGDTAIKQGNNGKDKTEGATTNNIFGTYMHGPILSKSPIFADFLIALALATRGQNIELQPLDDAIESRALDVAKTRPR